MTGDWASMPLVHDDEMDEQTYSVRPKYRVDTNFVIHQGDHAYFPLNGDHETKGLLEQPDVQVLTDGEVAALKEELPVPLPTPHIRNGPLTDSGRRRVGLGDVIAAVLHKMGFTECAGCRKRRRWLNKIPIRRR